MTLSKLTKLCVAATVMLSSATAAITAIAPSAFGQQQLVAMADPSAMVIICFRMSPRTTDADKQAVMNYLSQQGLYQVGFKPNGYECTAQGTCSDMMRIMKSQLYVAQLTLSNQMILAYRFDPLPTNPLDLKNKARYAYISEAPGYGSGSSSATFPNGQGQGGYNQGGYVGGNNQGGSGNGEPPLNMYPGQGNNQAGGQYGGGQTGGQYDGQYAGGGGSQFGNTGNGGYGNGGQPVQTSPFGNTTPAYNPNGVVSYPNPLKAGTTPPPNYGQTNTGTTYGGQNAPPSNTQAPAYNPTVPAYNPNASSAPTGSQNNNQSAPPNLGPPIQGTAGPPI